MVLKQDERSRTIITIVLFGLSLLTYFCVWIFAQRGTCPVSAESFRNETSDDTSNSNTISGILANIQRVSGVLLNPSTWTERIEMYSMTPVELARHYMKKSQAKEEDDEAV
jgi:hypothetical protein